jgi:cobalt-zinc-cadmium efflux system outer membrane protein
MPCFHARLAARLHFCLCVLVLAAAVPADAESAGALTLADAIHRAAASDPAATAARHRVEAARHRAHASGAFPSPVLEADAENWGGAAGSSILETTVGVGQRLELGGDRRARERAARGEADVAEHDARVARLERAAVVALDFVAAWAATERERRLVEWSRLAAEARAAASGRVRAGAASPVEELRARAEQARVSSLLARATAEVAATRHRLGAYWGGPAPTDSLHLPPPQVGADTAGSARPIPEHPARARARAAVTAAAAQRALAMAERVPDLEARLGARRMADEGTGFVASVSVPLPWFGRGSAHVAGARGDEEAAQFEFDAGERERAAESSSAALRMVAAAGAWAQLAGEAAPAAEAARREVQAGYREGRWSWTELSDAWRSALELQLDVVDAAAEAWRARIEWMRLTGATIEEVTR